MPGRPHVVVNCQKTDIYALQDANSATLLIETLNANPPNPFLGRILRYEPARAFRTLIISYRFVLQYVSTSLNNSIVRSPIYTCPMNYSSGPIKDQLTEMELPTAMRVWKHNNSRLESMGLCTRRLLNNSFRFHSILYNAQALQAAENQSRPGPSESEAVSLHPLKYDEEVHISFKDGDCIKHICLEPKRSSCVLRCFGKF